ncbi:LysR substrate-binding domain-containing protein [Acinetobacter sp. MD2(2019)]|uniref:LysR substrate-binding domain-containing protein n=1 Tax=Acinetobacter sp. MD2(2019) TaxID=2605273 RepID=UPI002D1F92FE|nr:LysR substrate-binding domain-containing protein [Acinetobacter sp. MD2(2019)]MEB3753088.1 LysR family transcriptional regulator [Acinetobacter sp. MD2(2019)]
MELRHLRYFITVAEELNFSRAALKLYTAQPSLSQQIKDLEEEIGVRLLNRTKRKVELTEEGAVFLEHARLTLMQAEKAVQLARQVHFRKQQNLKIGFIATTEVYVFPKVMPKLRIQTPDIHVELEQLHDQDQSRALKRGDFDVIFSRENLNDDELISQVVLQDSLEVILPKHHPLANLQRIPLEELQQQTLIMVNIPAHAVLNQTILQFLERNNLHPKINKKYDNLVEAISDIKNGAGYTILPQYLDPFIELDQMSVRQLNCDLPTLHLYVSYRQQNNNIAVEKFLSVVAQQLNLKLNNQKNGLF